MTISAGSDTQVYRNEAIVVSGYTTSNLAPNQTLSGMSAYRSEKNVGNYDVVLLGTPVVMDATQNDVTENYVFIKNDGKLIITPAQIALSIKAKGDTKIYNGGMQVVSGYDVEGLLSGHELVGVSASASGTDYGTYSSEVLGKAVILDGQEDVTQNYVITKTASELKIDKRDITIKANSDTYV